MNDNDFKDDNTPDNDINPEQNSKIYFYLAVVCTAIAAATLGLAFSPFGIYSLIGSVISELAALSFLSTQKKKNNFKGVFYLTVITYVLLAASIILFVGGMLSVALNQ